MSVDDFLREPRRRARVYARWHLPSGPAIALRALVQMTNLMREHRRLSDELAAARMRRINAASQAERARVGLSVELYAQVLGRIDAQVANIARRWVH